MAGYHKRRIKRGVYGELSKLREELCEAEDAQAQGAKLMVLLELSDLLGAVEGFLEKHHPNTTIDDLSRMAALTKRAFKQGVRR